MLRRLAEWLVYSQVWIALGAACQVLLSLTYLSGTSYERFLVEGLRYTAVIGLGSIAFYAFHRLYTLAQLRKKSIGLPPRWQLTAQYGTWLRVSVPIALTLAAFAAWSLPLVWILAAIAPASFSALYVVPVVKGKRVRDFGWLKPIWLTVGWVWVCHGVPVLMSGSALWGHVAERGLFILGFVLLFDFRDQDLDAQTGVRTLSARLGRQSCAALSFVLLLASLAMQFHLASAVATVPADLGWMLTVTLSVTSVLTLMLVARAYWQPAGHLHYGFWLDAMLVLPIPLLLLGLAVVG